VAQTQVKEINKGILTGVVVEMTAILPVKAAVQAAIPIL